MRTLVFVLLTALFVTSVFAQQNSTPNLMPLPLEAQYGSGSLPIDTKFTVAVTGEDQARIQRAVQRMAATIARGTGIPLKAQTADAAKATLVVHVAKASEKIQKVGEDESYTLTITPTQAKLEAPTSLGALRGLQTIVQLVQLTPANYALPVVSVNDRPRFAWRGLMLDVSRHFLPIEVVKRNLDAMEAVKLNVMHWHLTDNQGFRVESRKFPKLHQMGSDGQFYTQAEVKDVIDYARDRGIRVVPEFDIPGHSTSWFVGHPELASGPGPYQIERNWGIFDPAMDPTKESTYKFLDKFIKEMAGLFPDQYFHIGGDEVNGKEWDSNAKIQEFKRSNNLKDNHDLQAYFNQKVLKIVEKHHKTMIGWDEILRPDLPKSTVVHSWRGQKSLAEAARQGYSGILSNGYYIDLQEPASRHYLNDPLEGETAGLNDEEKKRVLGGEATMWAEYVTPENVDARIWPRTAVIAERLWSPGTVKDLASMYDRMGAVSRRLEWTGLTHRESYESMLQRMIGDGDPSAIRVLAEAVSPVKGYARGGQYFKTTGQRYSSFTPLNRMVDVARPDSPTVLRFASVVDRISATAPSANDVADARAILEMWRDNDAKLSGQLQQTYLGRELLPVSQNLRTVAEIGLKALDDLQANRKADEASFRQTIDAIRTASQPAAEVEISAAASVEKLVGTAAGLPVPPRPQAKR